MGYTQIVAYPRRDTSTFDETYYNTSHMPLVEKHWKSFGLTSWKVVKFASDAPYSHAALLEWDSAESFQEALKQESTAEIMGDVVKFSNEQPIMLSGTPISQSSY